MHWLVPATRIFLPANDPGELILRVPTVVLFCVRNTVLRNLTYVNCVAVFLLACASGQPSDGFVNPLLNDVYVPLSRNSNIFLVRSGAATVVAPHIAVTNAHNSELIAPEEVLAQSQEYDLLFFRTDYSKSPATAAPRIGQDVIAYGQGNGGDLREANGVIRALDEAVASRCEECREQSAIVFDADAGPGFSGGPVVDAVTGSVLAIVFGYRDDPTAASSRLMFAYDIALVRAEMDRLLSRDSR